MSAISVMSRTSFFLPSRSREGTEGWARAINSRYASSRSSALNSRSTRGERAPTPSPSRLREGGKKK